VARVVDTYGRPMIFNNNALRHIVIEFPITDEIETAGTEEVLSSSAKLMD